MQADPRQRILRAEEEVARGGSSRVAIVDLMSAEIVVDVDGAARASVMVLGSSLDDSAVDPLAGIKQRCRHRARVVGREMRDVGRSPQRPVARHVEAQLGKAAVLVEAHVVAVIVATLIVGSDLAEESAGTHAIVGIGLQRIVRTRPHVDTRANAFAFMSFRDDVHDAPHRIGAVEQRCRAADNLHAFGHHRLVGIGYGMAEDALILRMPVHEHHHLSRARIHAAYIDAACRAAADAVAHQATLRDE